MGQYDELTDEEIMARLLAISPDEMATHPAAEKYAAVLYNRYHRQCYGLCRYFGLRRSDAEDNAQEIFLKFMTKIQYFKAGSRFKPWFMTLAANHIRDYLRARKYRNHNDIELYTESLGASDRNISEKFPIQDQLNRIFSILPDRQKTVLILKTYQDLTFEEIGSALGVSPRQVRNILDQAYSAVKAALGENYAV